jgi:AcrR family transcriptional regulator
VGEVPEVIWMRPERPERGPRPTYSRAQITGAAIKIADAEGLDAASFRRVAAEIGAGTMSLYRYVPRRDDLIQLMIDAVIGELELPERSSGDWRADLALVAHGIRALGLRHPWLMELLGMRLVFGPNVMRLIEFGVGALDGHGLAIDEMMSLYGLVDGYVQNFVRGEISWAEEERRTGVSVEQWMMSNAPYLRPLIESGEHPILARIIKDARQPHMDIDARFRYGLNRVLDSVAASLPAGSDEIRSDEIRLDQILPEETRPDPGRTDMAQSDVSRSETSRADTGQSASTGRANRA